MCSNHWLQHGHHEGPGLSNGAIPSHSANAVRGHVALARAVKKKDYVTCTNTVQLSTGLKKT